MGIQMVIELTDEQGAQAVFQALESYKARLRAGDEEFEKTVDYVLQKNAELYRRLA